MSFDPSSTRVGYQLGRLFAILERCQEDAKRCQENAKRCQENAIGSNVNSTIKDRYFGSAMTTPAVILPRLLKLNAHHLHSIGAAGQRVVREKELGEVMSAIASFPRTLRLEDQGLFAIGYYHQRQTYFTKKDEQPVA
jgi:CRISPR-associated protein Csd1